MHDNKVRLSRDVLEKAESIAAEWGLKNARAAVEAVFRRYCDLYLQEHGVSPPTAASVTQPVVVPTASQQNGASANKAHCEALDALDELLAL